MKTNLLIFASAIMVVALSSCNLFSPLNRFDKEIRSEYDYIVYIRKDPDSKVVSAINYPDGSRRFVDGMNVAKVLSENQMSRALFMYSGPFETSEQILKPIYMEEYKKWAIQEGYISGKD